jgi:hypothetical protein
LHAAMNQVADLSRLAALYLPSEES